MVNSTIVKFTSLNTEQVASFTGDQDPETLKDALVEFYPFLGTATYTETIDEEAGVKQVVFAERLGTKGGSEI